MTKELCKDVHECSSCHKETSCGPTYLWACPWRNDDKDFTCCEACLDKISEDMLAWELAQAHKEGN